MSRRQRGKKVTPHQGDSREKRERTSLRRYLGLLSDSAGTAKPGYKTIDHVSSDWNVPADDLRDFRDGKDEALDRSLVSTLNKILGHDDAGMLGVDIDDTAYGDPSTGGWYGSLMAEEAARRGRLQMFQLIDRSRSEANSALHAWADLGITGNIGESMRYGGGWQPVCYETPAYITNLFKDTLEPLVNGRLLPDDQKLLVFRGLAKFGDQFGELGLDQQGGKFVLDRLTPRHPRTMAIVRGTKGEYNPNYAYKQTLPGKNEPIAKFPEWKIAQFSNPQNWGDLYGTSLFEPCLRAYIQVETMESGMITRRLERAPMRYKRTIDAGFIGGGEDELRKFKLRFRDDHRKIRTVDSNRQFNKQKITPPAGEDEFIFKRDKDSPADLEVLAGDEYIEQIADFIHFFKKWLSGLGVPSAHLGYEDESSKTGVNDKHIVFARRVRRMQIHFAKGLNHLYWVSLILKGIDPRTVRYAIFPPAMGTRDELIRAQVMVARSTVVNYLATAFGQTGKMPSIAWFLRYILELDDDVIRDDVLQLTAVLPKSGGTGNSGFNKNPPPKNVKDRREQQEMAAAALSQPKVAEQVRVTRWMMNERAIELRLPEAREYFARMTVPFAGRRFDQIVRTMGIKELRAAA